MKAVEILCEIRDKYCNGFIIWVAPGYDNFRF
jgi:hypothetical protein